MQDLRLSIDIQLPSHNEWYELAEPPGPASKTETQKQKEPGASAPGSVEHREKDTAGAWAPAPNIT
jgi:hypothetical protein